MLSAIGHFFAKIGQLVGKALKLAVAEGLNDVLIHEVLSLVRVAAIKFTDDGEKREWVVRILVARGIPESVARIAVELAFKLFQREVATLLDPPANSTVTKP